MIQVIRRPAPRRQRGGWLLGVAAVAYVSLLAGWSAYATVVMR